MKSIFTIALFISASIGAQAQPAKTLVKSFNLLGNTSVSLDLKGEVNVQSWDKDIVQIQIEIYNEQFNGRIVKSLIAAGRYNLKGNEDNGIFVINAPALEKTVKIRGTILKDKVQYKVFAPEKVDVRINNLESVMTEVTTTNGNP